MNNVTLNDFSTAENLTIAVINLFNLVLNVLCVFIFIKNDLRKKSRCDLFNYFLVESINNSTMGLLNIFSVFIFEFVDEITPKLFAFKAYFYLIGIFTMNANLLEVTASLIRYLTIDERFRAFRRRIVDYRLIILFEILFSMSITMFRIFLSDLVDIQSLKQFSRVFEVEFGVNDVVLKWLAFSYSFIRDVVCTLVLLVINGFMVVLFRKNMLKKKFMHGSRPIMRNKEFVERQPQNDVTLMVIFISLKNILCHLPYFLIYQTFTNYFLNNKLLNIFAPVLIDLSYCFNFFIYLKFNKRFRENFSLVLTQMISSISKYSVLRIGTSSGAYLTTQRHTQVSNLSN